MKKGVIVIPDDDDCEDLGDLCDFELESIPSQELIDPLDLIGIDTNTKAVPETEQEQPIDQEQPINQEQFIGQEYDLIEIIDSSEEQENLEDLEDPLPNQAISSVLNLDNDAQSYSEAPPNIPDYSLLTIKELQVSIARYGFKNLRSREKMVSILESIRASENLQTPQVTSASDNDEERRMIIQHIKSQENVWKKILRYETVDVDEVYHGLTCKKSKVKAVLDEFAALKKRHRRLDTNAT